MRRLDERQRVAEVKARQLQWRNKVGNSDVGEAELHPPLHDGMETLGAQQVEGTAHKEHVDSMQPSQLSWAMASKELRQEAARVRHRRRHTL